MPKILLFANTDWYLYNFRRALAEELRAQGNEVILLSPPGGYQNLLLEHGFQWVSFRLSRQGVNPLGELWTILRLMRIYRQIEPDIVHHFTVKPVIYGSIAARLLGVRGIVNSITGLGHLFIHPGFFVGVLRGITKILYRLSLRGTQVIFENPADQETFIRNRFIEPKQAHLVLGTGVDVNRFRPAPKHNDQPLILFAGRWLATKGIHEFVEAAQRVKHKGSKARFAIAGTVDPGNPASVPPEQIEAWKRSNAVEFWGWQADMPSVLAQTDIFCLPSYREGVPSALLEACASGLPIIATDVPGCRDVVEGGINGLLVPPQNSDALADAIETLLADPSLRDKLGQAGRQLALEKFSLENITTQTLKVYRKALEP
jgi:glycosyltransferase involved in cell wall biosynthesis